MARVCMALAAMASLALAAVTVDAVTARLPQPHLTFAAPPAGSTAPVQGDVFSLPDGTYGLALYASSTSGDWWGLRTTATLRVGAGATTDDHASTPFTLTQWAADANDAMQATHLRVVLLSSPSVTAPAIIRPGRAPASFARSVLLAAEAPRGAHGDSGRLAAGDASPAVRRPSWARRLAGALLPRRLQSTSTSWGDYWYPPTTTGGAGGAAAVTMIVSAPPLGSADMLVGRVTGGLPAPMSAYRVYVWTMSPTYYELWGPKAGAAVGADGAFQVAGWATDPSDTYAAPLLVVGLFRSGYTPPAVAGQPSMPPDVMINALALATVARGGVATATGGGGGGGSVPVAPWSTPPPPAVPQQPQQPQQPQAASPWHPAPPLPPAVPPPPATSGQQFQINVPPTGTTGVIRGVVIGSLQKPSAYSAVAFTQDQWSQWWGPKASITPRDDGYFEISGWAQASGDVSAPVIGVFLMPRGMVVPTVSGTSLPPNVMSAQAGAAINARAAPQPALPQPVPWTPPAAPTPAPYVPAPPTGGGGTSGGGGGGATGGSGGGGSISLPADPGAPVAVPSGGKIDFGGRSWIVKDSSGGAVGPGPNVFVGSSDFVWVDAWGLHLNVRPRSGCSNFASSEVWLDRPLGYGTYVWSFYGPGENLDVQVVLGAFLWDDSGGQSIGWREIDFEICRWGDPSNPTAAQFVLEPLRPGNLPGWIKRFWMSGMTNFGGSGAGSGGCNDGGAANFNGAATERMTCALVWGPGQLRWYCWDGLYSLQSLQAGTAGARLVASYQYPNPEYIPPPGDERWHFNAWQANQGTPANGRRVHAVFPTFEHTKELVDFKGAQLNTGIGGRLLAGAPQVTTQEELQAAEAEAGLERQQGAAARRGRRLQPAVEAPPYVPGFERAAGGGSDSYGAPQPQVLLLEGSGGSGGGDDEEGTTATTAEAAALLAQALRRLRVPARDLTDEAQAIFASQQGLPPAAAAAVYAALAVLALAGLAAGVRALTQPRKPRGTLPLVVTRSLVAALGKGLGGLSPDDVSIGAGRGGVDAFLSGLAAAAELQAAGGGAGGGGGAAAAAAADAAAATSIAASRPRRRSSVGGGSGY